ncbi:hypothetical protein DPEC_G00188370 [Dallia pectoralis]|uniref:Uncharacterized protein n=1 Tax=Dallia pectoralis TaxID=75939 RepID=A0ACC2GBX5_DALPE|nr:hypothetical protein DPEC_G00188370 [Dallia pectoralis]
MCRLNDASLFSASYNRGSLQPRGLTLHSPFETLRPGAAKLYFPETFELSVLHRRAIALKLIARKRGIDEYNPLEQIYGRSSVTSWQRTRRGNGITEGGPPPSGPGSWADAYGSDDWPISLRGYQREQMKGRGGLGSDERQAAIW